MEEAAKSKLISHYISTLSIGHNYICTHCLIHMGDIARYKGQVKQAESFYKHSRISSNKTRGYYFFTRPSTAGIIRTRVLIEGWYYQDLMNIDIKTRKSQHLYSLNLALFAWRHEE